MIWTEEEIRSWTVRQTEQRLREFAKTYNLDASLTKNPELLRQADLLANQLIAMEDWLDALKTHEAVEVPEGRFHSVQEASRITGVEEGTIYYRLTSQPETYYKLNPASTT